METSSPKDMTAVQSSLHQIEYGTTDLDRQSEVQRRSLNDTELRVLGQYFKKDVPTLEIGTGGGRIAFGMARLGFSSIVAIDFVEGFVKQAKAYAAQIGVNIQFEVGDALDLKFASESFSQVIAGGALLSHFPATGRRKVLSEIHRVLNKDGIMILNAQNLYRHRYLRFLKFGIGLLRLLGNPLEYKRNDLPRLGGRNGRLDPLFFRPTKSATHHYYPIEFIRDLNAAGFSVVDMNYRESAEESLSERDLFWKRGWVLAVCRKS